MKNNSLLFVKFISMYKIPYINQHRNNKLCHAYNYTKTIAVYKYANIIVKILENENIVPSSLGKNNPITHHYHVHMFMDLHA